MKYSIFNTIVQEDDSLLIYNSLSGALLRVPKNKINEYKELFYKEGFLVEDNKEELLTYKYIYYKKLFDNNRIDITIAPTTNCNLCCPYCFEEGHKYEEYMTQEVSDSIIEYILSKKDRDIHITWFGGEPLLCFDRIIYISRKLVDNNVHFQASMITNGTLFTDYKIENLSYLNLKSIQITLDGEKAEHNQKRFFKNKQGTFDLILSNVNKLLEKTSIHITLKINIDKNNIRSYVSLVDSLTKSYKKYIANKQLTILNNSVKNRTDYEGCTQCLSENEYFEFKTNILHEKKTIPQLHLACPLRHSGTLMIGPDGSIYKCLEQIGDKFKSIGNIKAHSISISKMARFALGNEPFNDIECSNCSILPICGGGCPIDRDKKASGKNISLCPSIKENLSTIIREVCNTQSDKK